MAITTPTKRTPDITALVSESGILSISFASGNVIELNPSQLDSAIQREALLHGLKQKLVDAGAIGRDIVTGRSAAAADKEAAVMEVYNRIAAIDGSATWNKVRDGSSGGTGGLLVAALMKMSGKPRADILAMLANKTNEEKTALRKNSRVVAIIETLQATKSTEDESNAMLAGLGIAEEGDDDSDESPNVSIDLD